jgi:hypothetical protein
MISMPKNALPKKFTINLREAGWIEAVHFRKNTICFHPPAGKSRFGESV